MNSQLSAANEYRFEKYRVLPAARELWFDDQLLPCPRLVFDCLTYLIEHANRAVGHDELVSAVWGRIDVAEARVRELIVRTRRMIGDDGQVQHTIRTVPGFGYRWIATIEMPQRDVDLSNDLANEDDRNESDAAAPIEVTSPPDGDDGGSARHSAAIDTPSISLALPTGIDLSSARAPTAVEDMPDRPNRSSRSERLARTGFLAIAAALTITIWASWRLNNADTAPNSSADASPTAINDTVIVLPLRVDAGPESSWVRLGAMDLVGEQLRNSGLPVLPSESVLMLLDPNADEAYAQANELAQRLGKIAVVQGDAVFRDGEWRVALNGTVQNGHSQRVEARSRNVIDATRLAADRLVIALGGTRPSQTPAPDDPDIERSLRETEALMLGGWLEEARDRLSQTSNMPDHEPRIGLQLARLEQLSGRLDAAETAYTSLLATLKPTADPVLRGRALVGRASVLFRKRRFVEAERDFNAAAAILARANAPRELGRALSGRGGTHIALDNLDGAVDDLGRARVLLKQAGDYAGLAQVDLYFGLLESQRGRFDLALPRLRQAAEGFDTLGIAERTLAALLALLDAQVAMLHWNDALATSDRQWELRNRANDPALELLISSRRARVLLALGRHNEAAGLLTEMKSRSGEVRRQSQRYLHDFEATVAWHLHRERNAAAAAELALEDWPASTAFRRYGLLVLTRQRALIALGESDTELIESMLPSDESLELSTPLEIARAEWSAHLGEVERARTYFDAASRHAQDRGVPSDIALVAVAYGEWLLSRRELERASALAGLAAQWAREDFDCALFQVALYHALGQRDAWHEALTRAQALAGEREIPAPLEVAPIG